MIKFELDIGHHDDCVMCEYRFKNTLLFLGDVIQSFENGQPTKKHNTNSRSSFTQGINVDLNINMTLCKIY